jgi:hypothetical protein
LRSVGLRRIYLRDSQIYGLGMRGGLNMS